MNSTETIIHGWKASGIERGTLDLVYDCSLTIFLCCWSSLHMNVPADDDSRTTCFLRQVKSMIICILAPEFLACLAMVEFFNAWLMRLELAKIPQLQDQGWTLIHIFLLTMGGISLESADGGSFRPSAQHFLNLVLNDHVKVSKLDLEEIDDKNKTSWIVKALALAQILWFAAGVLARAVQHLPVTTLELFTIAIIFYSIITYASWWHKPRDIQRPFSFQTSLSLADLKAGIHPGIHPGVSFYHDFEEPGKRISLRDSNESGDAARKMDDRRYTSAILVVMFTFGPWHLLGWFFHFNSSTERLLWRISSVGCTAVPVISALYSRFVDSLKGRLKRGFRVVDHWAMKGMTDLYFLFRFYMIIESLIGLRAVPAGVYQKVSWLNIIPHYGA